MSISDVGECILIKVSRYLLICYKVQASLLKQGVEHDEIYEDSWEAREHEWLRYVKNDVLSTAFCFARYIMGMEE